MSGFGVRKDRETLRKKKKNGTTEKRKNVSL